MCLYFPYILNIKSQIKTQYWNLKDLLSILFQKRNKLNKSNIESLKFLSNFTGRGKMSLVAREQKRIIISSESEMCKFLKIQKIPNTN